MAVVVTVWVLLKLKVNSAMVVALILCALVVMAVTVVVYKKNHI